MPMVDDQLIEIANAISNAISEVTQVIDFIDSQMESLALQKINLSIDDFSGIGKVLPAKIVEFKNWIRGAGVAYGPEDVLEHKLWMDWWDMRSQNNATFKEHAFSRNSMRYYDYTSSNWYLRALGDFEVHACGPYLDAGGTESIVMTISRKSSVPGLSKTVIAADFLPASLESLLLSLTNSTDGNVAILEESGKVLASTSKELLFGRRLGLTHGYEAVNGPGDTRKWSVVRF